MSDPDTFWHYSPAAERLEKAREQRARTIEFFIPYVGRYEIVVPVLSEWYSTEFSPPGSSIWTALPYAVKLHGTGESEWIIGSKNPVLKTIRERNSYRQREELSQIGATFWEKYKEQNTFTAADLYTYHEDIDDQVQTLKTYYLLNGDTIEVWKFLDRSGYCWIIREDIDEGSDIIYYSPVMQSAPTKTQIIRELITEE